MQTETFHFSMQLMCSTHAVLVIQHNYDIDSAFIKYNILSDTCPSPRSHLRVDVDGYVHVCLRMLWDEHSIATRPSNGVGCRDYTSTPTHND